MIAASFEQSNQVLSAPEGMTHEEVNPLSVCITTDEAGLPLVISCWKVTADELIEIARTGRIWLGVVGQTMPPVWLMGTNPFNAGIE
jgi:hypothetical protein